MSNATLSLHGITKTFGSVNALDGFDLEVRPGEMMVLVGPSGSGKTTALHVVAGLVHPDAGELTCDGRSLAGLAPKDRDVAMVFQDGALYPHLTVAQNLAFPLRARGKRGKHAVERMANRLHIAHLLKRYPAEISGGEAQRVALGRALIRKPKVFLLDEPLSRLDQPLREELRGLIRDLVVERSVTTLYVTHDQAEAMAIGDRLAVMHQGRAIQIDAPQGIYEKPQNAFVASFFGSPTMNMLEGHADNNVISGVWGRLPIAWMAAGRTVLCAFRPEHVRIDVRAAGLSGRVARVDFFGHEVVVAVALEGEAEVQLRRSAAGPVPKPGSEVGLAVDSKALLLFDAETGERL